MAWSDAARKAAAEARKRRSQSLNTEIVRGIGGVNKSMTISALRSVAVRTILHNRKIFKPLAMVVAAKNELLYKTAEATIRLRKSQMMRGMERLHPMYSKGLSKKKMGLG